MKKFLIAFSFFIFLFVSLQAQKEVYIPKEFVSRGIPYSMERSYQTDNFIIFWGEKAGVNPELAPSAISFKPAEVGLIFESIFSFFMNDIKLVPADKPNISKYKFIIVINETWNPLPNGNEIFTGWAFGGSYDSKIGAMWVHPKALNRFTLAHEFTHCMDNMVWIEYPGHGFVNNDYVGSFWETHANFTALLANPTMVKNTDLPRFLNTQHFYFSSARHHYTNWMFLQYLKDTEGLELINRMWRESNFGEHPLQTLKRLKGYSQDQLNDMFGYYAMRNVTFDYSNSIEINKSYNSEIDKKLFTRRFTIPEAINISKGRYKVPFHLAPQDYGYNIVKLNKDAENTTGIIKIKFKGHENLNAGGGGWRIGFVFTKSDGSVRYSSLFKDEFDGEIAIEEGEKDLYIVVTGAPDVHHNYAWEPGWPKIYRFPWEICITGAKPDGYEADHNSKYWSVTGTRHPNGGGFVASTAYADITAYIGPGAVVIGNARVRNSANISGSAIITDNAIVQDNAKVEGWAIVGANALIKENAKVGEYSRVYNNTVVSGNSIIKGSASVYYSTIGEYTILKDNVWVWGSTFGGSVILGGDAENFASCNLGTYLQIYNLGNRGYDGLTEHSLNNDINPVFSNFTDLEMGTTTGISDIFNEKSFKIERISGSTEYLITFLNSADPVRSITLSNMEGRIIWMKNFSPREYSVNLKISGTGFFILRIETKNNLYSQKIVNVKQ